MPQISISRQPRDSHELQTLRIGLLWIPSLAPFAYYSSMDFAPGIGSFVYGTVMVGGILALMKLFGPESQREYRRGWRE